MICDLFARVIFPDERLVMQFQAVVVKVSEHRDGVKRFLRREQRGRREKGGGPTVFLFMIPLFQ